jgi:ADP-ribose pyrophosphatase YjhB (NUDIX family)
VVIWRTALYRLIQLYWRVFKPTVLGSRVIVARDGQVLLVRLSYAKGWYLPGGGLKKRESFQQAALRELREECGLNAENAELFGLYFSTRHGKADHVAIFTITEFTKLEGSTRDPEISEMGFFDLLELPPDTTPATRRRIGEYLAGRPTSIEW